jgi:RHS repeat-associated protein
MVLRSMYSVPTNGSAISLTQFVYDGDGSRVLQLLPDGSQTAYASALEVTITGTQRITKTYYSAGSQLIAMRQFTTPTSSVLYFLHSDHLGSTSLTTDQNGNALTRQLYDAWGNVRYVSGPMPTDIGFTGQRLDNSTGLMYYRARYYAQGLGRFISADTIVPDGRNPQSLNRFSYTRNNPLKYIDPTGHRETDGCDYEGCSATQNDLDKAIGNAERAKAQKFYRGCAQGGGAECNSLHDVENIVKGVGLAFAGLATGGLFYGVESGIAWANVGAAAYSGLAYTVGNGAVNLLKTRGDLSHFGDGWNLTDFALSAVSGGLISELQLGVRGIGLLSAGQSAVSQILQGQAVDGGQMLLSGGLGVISGRLTSGSSAPAKSILYGTAKSLTADTSLAVTGAAISDLPRVVGQGISQAISNLRALTQSVFPPFGFSQSGP